MPPPRVVPRRPSHPAPEPEPREPAPRRGRVSQSDAERLETIAKAAKSVDKEATRAHVVMDNIGYQTELGGYAHKRGVFPGKLIPYLVKRLDGVTSEGVQRAAEEAAFSSIVAYEGSRGGRNIVYSAVRAAIDHVADAKCDVDKQARVLRQSIAALDKLSRKPPPCPCNDCGDERAAKAD